jgi:hypothetical protein
MCMLEQSNVMQFNEVSIVDGLCEGVFVAVIYERQLPLMMCAKKCVIYFGVHISTYI